MNDKEFYKITLNVIFRTYKNGKEAWGVYKSIADKMTDRQAHNLCTDIINFYGHYTAK